MTYFSRLSDIVSCSIPDLLRESAEPSIELAAIIAEMEQGLAAAQRSAQAANQSHARLNQDLEDNRRQIESWGQQAKDQLAAGDEQAARRSLLRKRELADLTAGLEQHFAAAAATRQQLSTTLRAIEARLAEAYRTRDALLSSSDSQKTFAAASEPVIAAAPWGGSERHRADQIEAELEQLREELRRNG